MAYKTYYLRGPTRADLLSDLQSVLTPEVSQYLTEDPDTGELSIDTSVAVLVPEGEWWLTPPEWDHSTDPPTKTKSGTAADYAILNVRTDDPALQELIESFAPSDPAKEPSKVPAEEKIGTGTHRVTEPSTPARVFQ